MTSWSRSRDDTLVLCYHALSRDWPAELAATPRRFLEQMTYLVRHGYRSIDFADLPDADGRGRVVSLTFDDAFTSVLDLALPILERFGLTATLFVPTGFVDSREPMVWEGTRHWLDLGYRSELTCMTSDQIRRLADAGWEIAAHSVDHPYLSELEEEELTHQLTASKEACEEISGRPCRSFAYPYGDADETVLRAAEAAGFTVAAGLSPDLSRSHRYYWARTGIYRDDGRIRFRLKCSPLVRSMRSRGGNGGGLAAADRSDPRDSP